MHGNVARQPIVKNYSTVTALSNNQLSGQGKIKKTCPCMKKCGEETGARKGAYCRWEHGHPQHDSDFLYTISGCKVKVGHTDT